MEQIIMYIQLSLFTAFVFSAIYLVFNLLTEKRNK